MLPIQFLTVHCAATPEGRDVKAGTIEQWDIAKFGQKSYHRIVELDGADHRSLSDQVRGAHVGGHNTGNIGVCYVGGCDEHMRGAKDTRTPAQTATLERIVREYIAKYPAIRIRGHNEWPGVAKACPSFSVRAWLNSLGLGRYAA
jgi:N-acetyl-anhydromuramyl-L-alanine amidase AmpD